MVPVLSFGVPGGQEWILVVLVVVLLFGASKLPELARSAGSALGEFKAARYEAEQEFQEVKKEAMEGEPGEELADEEAEATETTEEKEAEKAKAESEEAVEKLEEEE